MLAHATGDMGGDGVTVIELHPKGGVGKGFDNLAFHFNMFFFGHSDLIAVVGVARIIGLPPVEFNA